MGRTIEHVVVLMLENRSFDHLLGTLPNVHGITYAVPNPRRDGKTFVSAYPSTDPALAPSPQHDLKGVLEQLSNGNTGFVRDYEGTDGVNDSNVANPMAYYGGTDLTSPVAALQTLATQYRVSDQYFCSLPAETWPNRFFVHAATSGGHVRNDKRLYHMPTIFDHLDAPDVRLTWKVYCDFIPQVACFERLGLEWVRTRGASGSRFASLEQFDRDCQSGELPSYSFIEPNYLIPGGDDDHPPHDLFKGDALIREVHAAVHGSPKWPTTVLIVTFDEHGGFYDHVSPPAAPPPGLVNTDDQVDPDGREFDFKSLGPRVPFVLVADGLEPGEPLRPPDGGFFDHTSILATVERLWGLPALSDRDQAASDFLDVLGAEPMRIDRLAQVDLEARAEDLLEAERTRSRGRLDLIRPSWPAWGIVGDVAGNRARHETTDLASSLSWMAFRLVIQAVAVKLRGRLRLRTQ